VHSFAKEYRYHIGTVCWVGGLLDARKKCDADGERGGEKKAGMKRRGKKNNLNKREPSDSASAFSSPQIKERKIRAQTKATNEDAEDRKILVERFRSKKKTSEGTNVTCVSTPKHTPKRTKQSPTHTLKVCRKGKTGRGKEREKQT